MNAGRPLDAEHRLAEVARAASHDLREPLRAIAGFTELLHDHLGDELDDRGRQYLAHVVGGVERMDAMVTALLAWLRAGQADLTPALVDLDEVMREVVDGLTDADADAWVRAGAGAGSHPDAEVSIGPLPTVVGDPALLLQLFHHLVANALTFRRPDRRHRVEVTAEERGGAWAITVADSGVGIPPQQRERVFGVFERLHTRDEHPGTGIGLAICRAIAQRHGATITVAEGIEGGTAVTVVLGDVSGTGQGPVPSVP